MYLDRFLVASFVSLEAVTFYTVPYEALTRLRIIPTSLITTLYPAMSERSGELVRGRLQALHNGSLRYLLLLLVPGISFLVVFGPDVFSIWMGSTFAAKAAPVLQILGLGFLLNSLAYVSYTAIQAMGKPDLVGKYHVLVLPFYLGLSLTLIYHWGMVGAALAATLRFGSDSLLLFWVADRH
jgi:O-antigen/teichoic acid export membrane protein